MNCPSANLSENLVYPISGRIGIFEVIDTFIDLNQTTQLDTIDKGVNVFADTLKFTTAIIASATPKIILSPVGKEIGLSGTSLTASAERQDDHQLIVGLSFPAPKEGVRQIVSGRAARIAAPFTARPGAVEKTSQENRALDAVIDQRYNTFLDRFGKTLR